MKKAGESRPAIFKLHDSLRIQNPSIEGRYYPSIYGLPAHSVEVITDDGSLDILNLVKGETSPFLSKQKQKTWREGDYLRVQFDSGTLIVHETQMSKLSFMRNHPRNVANCQKYGLSPLFYEVDQEAEANAYVESAFEVSELIVTIKKANQASVISMAASLGIDTKGLTVGEIKRNLLYAAQQSPQHFRKMTNDPLANVLGFVSELLEYFILTYDVSKYQFRWADASAAVSGPVFTAKDNDSANREFAKFLTDSKSSELKAKLEKALEEVKS